MAIFIALLGCSSCSKDNDDSAPEPPGTETVELSMVDKVQQPKLRLCMPVYGIYSKPGSCLDTMMICSMAVNGMMFRAIPIRRRYAEIIRLYSV